MSDLSVELLGHRLRSPLVLASGIWGTSETLLQRAASHGFGAVTAKSCGPSPRSGHVNPSCVAWDHGLLNAIGLANPGVADEVTMLRAARTLLAKQKTPVIASIFAGTVAEFHEVAAQIVDAEPDMVEVNISCPNVGSEYGEPFAGSPASAASVTAAVKRALETAGIPVIVKLAPNVPSVPHIVRAVVDAGADAICAVNTMPGMLIDIESGRPILANQSGGISGPALKPIALKCVYEAFRTAPDVPIIGTGGVTNGHDAIEMVMAGATAVGVGSAIYYGGPDAAMEILRQIDAWLATHNIESLSSLRGVAHQEVAYETQPSTPPIPHVAS